MRSGRGSLALHPLSRESFCLTEPEVDDPALEAVRLRQELSDVLAFSQRLRQDAGYNEPVCDIPHE